jgi:hypothetical protein
VSLHPKWNGNSSASEEIDQVAEDMRLTNLRDAIQSLEKRNALVRKLAEPAMPQEKSRKRKGTPR